MRTKIEIRREIPSLPHGKINLFSMKYNIDDDTSMWLSGKLYNHVEEVVKDTPGMFTIYADIKVIAADIVKATRPNGNLKWEKTKVDNFDNLLEDHLYDIDYICVQEIEVEGLEDMNEPDYYLLDNDVNIGCRDIISIGDRSLNVNGDYCKESTQIIKSEEEELND